MLMTELIIFLIYKHSPSNVLSLSYNGILHDNLIVGGYTFLITLLPNTCGVNMCMQSVCRLCVPCPHPVLGPPYIPLLLLCPLPPFLSPPLSLVCIKRGLSYIVPTGHSYPSGHVSSYPFLWGERTTQLFGTLKKVRDSIASVSNVLYRLR